MDDLEDRNHHHDIRNTTQKGWWFVAEVIESQSEPEPCFDPSCSQCRAYRDTVQECAIRRSARLAGC